jgi:hypothetical protein
MAYQVILCVPRELFKIMYMIQKLHNDLGNYAYHLSFLNTWPTNRPIIRGVAIFHKQFGRPYHRQSVCIRVNEELAM